MADQSWDKRDDESAVAYAAFQAYTRLLPRDRSIDAAWRSAAKPQQDRVGKRAPRQWFTWSSDHEWVRRAAAYDQYLAEQDRLLWEDRRRQLRHRDWDQADRLRQVVEDGIDNARQFVRQNRTFIRGEDGEPDREIITLTFDIGALAQVMERASKLQRLATDEPTANIQLTGAALDAYIAEQLARVTHGGEASIGDGSEPDATEADSGAESDDSDV